MIPATKTRLTVTLAGHPPPVMIRADGEAVQVGVPVMSPVLVPWSPVVLHAAFCLPALGVVLGTWALARRLSGSSDLYQSDGRECALTAERARWRTLAGCRCRGATLCG